MKLTIKDISRIIEEIEEWEMEDQLDYWYYLSEIENAGDR